MIINTKGVELSENNFLNKEGNFLFRIEKFEEDGFTNNGDHRFKLHFKGIEVGIKEPVYIHSEQFNIGVKSLWRIKQLEVALKAPEIYDINNFIGRYVIATSKKEEYTKNDGTAGVVYKIKSWTYSELNDKMTPIPEAIENKDVSDSKSENVEIDDSEIPFSEVTAPIHKAVKFYVQCSNCETIFDTDKYDLCLEHDGDICGFCPKCKTSRIFFEVDEKGMEIFNA